MNQRTVAGVNFWQFENLSRQSGINHFVSGRQGAPRDDKPFTLSYSSTPDRDAVQANRARLARAMGVPEGQLYFPSQVHKTKIVTVTNATSKEALLETDALVTNTPGLCIAVMSADCVPILLYDRRHHAAAAVHSGWRGTVARILEKTLLHMRDSFGTRGEDLVAGIGPSVSQAAYEVGVEVVAAVEEAFGRESGLLVPQPAGKAKLDLWNANKMQLLAFGVAASDIEVSGLCTVASNDQFFSARKGDAGRFAAGIVLGKDHATQ